MDTASRIFSGVGHALGTGFREPQLRTEEGVSGSVMILVLDFHLPPSHTWLHSPPGEDEHKAGEEGLGMGMAVVNRVMTRRHLSHTVL